jgi:hypothetical protein
MELKPTTSLNIFVTQQYFCQRCKYIGQYDYDYIQLHGKMIKKPWKTKPRPKYCENCTRRLNYGKGMGPDVYIDSWSYVWLFWILMMISVGVFGWAMSHFFEVQILEEVGKIIFGKKYFN